MADPITITLAVLLPAFILLMSLGTALPAKKYLSEKLYKRLLEIEEQIRTSQQVTRAMEDKIELGVKRHPAILKYLVSEKTILQVAAENSNQKFQDLILEAILKKSSRGNIKLLNRHDTNGNVFFFSKGWVNQQIIKTAYRRAKYPQWVELLGFNDRDGTACLHAAFASLQQEFVRWIFTRLHPNDIANLLMIIDL